jgi:hypothetical protein
VEFSPGFGPTPPVSRIVHVLQPLMTQLF